MQFNGTPVLDRAEAAQASASKDKAAEAAMLARIRPLRASVSSRPGAGAGQAQAAKGGRK